MALAILHIGVGVRGGHWVGFVGAAPGLASAACVDIREEALDAIRDRRAQDGIACYTDLEQALSEVRADAALIATPSALHAEHAIRALEAGLPVLLEKPLGTSMEEARRILAKSAQTGKRVMVAENYRFWPAERTIRKAVADGLLGAILAASIRDCRNQPAEHEPAWLAGLEYPHLQEIGVHHFDSLRGYFQRDAVAVTARSWNPPGSGYAGGACTEALIEMEGGLHVQYFSSFLSRRYFHSITIEGERGVLWSNRKYVFFRRHGSRFFLPVKRVPVPAGDGAKYPRGGTGALLEAFRGMLLAGTEPETRAEDNIRSLAIVEAGKRSDREARTVRLEELLPGGG